MQREPADDEPEFTVEFRPYAELTDEELAEVEQAIRDEAPALPRVPRRRERPS